MGRDNEVSAMEVEDSNSEQITTKFSINVLQLLKSAQMQHGFRHEDYTRYRRYCTARLRRAITESTVTEVRFLHVVLYMAERAWSHAMEKRQLPDGPNARQRIYLIGRLRKAVKWANLFSHLCAIKGDSRTSLEAEAYASYMKGNLLFEQDQNWDTALMHFKSARDVYEQLGKYGDICYQYCASLLCLYTSHPVLRLFSASLVYDLWPAPFLYFFALPPAPHIFNILTSFRHLICSFISLATGDRSATNLVLILLCLYTSHPVLRLFSASLVYDLQPAPFLFFFALPPTPHIFNVLTSFRHLICRFPNLVYDGQSSTHVEPMEYIHKKNIR
ncbi:hypothetical protein SLA2020_117390 [Shorea laevis]